MVRVERGRFKFAVTLETSELEIVVLLHYMTVFYFLYAGNACRT